MTARLRYWYLTRPRWGRPALLLAVLQGLSIVAVSAAPRASASTNTMILNFTGLKDGYGVPIGDYYLAIASVHDQITQAGPDVNWNPATWTQWTIHTIDTMLTSLPVATMLTGEAGFFIGIVALALWVMKITVSAYWLSVIGGIARALCGAVIQVTTGLGLLVLAVPIGVFIGVVTIKRGEAGRGATMILVALTLPALSVAVFADPAGEMYGPNGLLVFARRIGFSVAEAGVRNGPLSGPGGGQIDTLTASLITHTVREPLQLWNFGHVVDPVGGCGAAWSAAVRTGASDAPIRAMAACGDHSAVAYAQHLDGTNIWVGLVFGCAALLLGAFMVISGWAVLKVSVKAIWTTVILLPTLWLGAVPGAPQRRAVDVVWQFFRHGIEVMVYIVYVSVIGLAVERIVSSPLPAELGGTNPFAHVLMMGATSIAGWVLLHHIRSDISGRAGPGMLRRAGGLAAGVGMEAACAAAGSASQPGAKGLWRRFTAGGRGTTPWERMDRAADNARAAHGDPQPGVDPVPNSAGGPDPGGDEPGRGDAASAAGGEVAPQGGGDGAAAPGGPAVGATGEGGRSAGSPGGGDGVAPVPDQPSGAAEGRRGERRPDQRRSGRHPGQLPQQPMDTTLEDPPNPSGAAAGGAGTQDEPSQVDPIVADRVASQTPPPTEEPPPEDVPSPPDDDPPPAPTTVDPVNDPVDGS